MTKPTNWHVRAAKTQVSLGIRPVWSEFSLSAWRKLWPLATHWAHMKDSDETGRMPTLIWVFAGRTDYFVSFVAGRFKWKNNNSNSQPKQVHRGETVSKTYWDRFQKPVLSLCYGALTLTKSGWRFEISEPGQNRKIWNLIFFFFFFFAFFFMSTNHWYVIFYTPALLQFVFYFWKTLSIY